MKKRVVIQKGKSLFFTDADLNTLEQKKLISFVMSQLGKSRSRKKIESGRKNIAKGREVLRLKRLKASRH